MTPLHLGPGSELPSWVEAVDLACFGEAWHALEDREHLWGEAPAGFSRWKLMPEWGEAELLRIGVDPAHRGQGLGRRLLRQGMEAVCAAGCEELRLEVRVSNAPARALYESEGWTLEGHRKGYYRDGEDAALYLWKAPVP